MHLRSLSPRFEWRAAARLIIMGLAVSCGALQVPAAAQPRPAPLPDPAAFLQKVREHLQSDRLLQSQYTYHEKRRKLQISRLGAVGLGPEKVYEVYPSPDESRTYRRLIAVDGVPLTAEELDAQDRDFRERWHAEVGAPGYAARRDRELREAQRKEREVVDDIYGLYRMELLGRETLDGHTVILGRFEPRQEYSPRTDLGRFLKRFKGQAWVSETDYQIVRLEAEAIEDVTVGLGLLGRLHRGATASFRRTRVDDRVWLPSEFRFRGTGRSLLFRRFDIEAVTQYSGYKRLPAGTDLRPGLSRPMSSAVQH